MTTPAVPALPHRWRLWLILGLTLVDVAALVAARYVGDELLAGLRPAIEIALYIVLALLFPANVDAILVELRRRQPGIPALPDDVTEEPAPRPRDRRPPTSGGGLALVLVVVAAACSLATTGCDTRALGVQADLVAAGGILWTEADTALVQVRARELDGILDAAREECGDAGCSPERADHYRAELAAAEARWAPAMECRGTVPAALRSWIDGIDAAREAQSSGVGLQLMTRLGGRFALDYVAFVACVNANAPEDPHLPALPDELETLAEQLAQATAARTAGGEDGTR